MRLKQSIGSPAQLLIANINFEEIALHNPSDLGHFECIAFQSVKLYGIEVQHKHCTMHTHVANGSDKFGRHARHVWYHHIVPACWSKGHALRQNSMHINSIFKVQSIYFEYPGWAGFP